MTTAQREVLSVTPASIELKIASINYMSLPGTTVTICNITLENGFSVRGESACADPLKYNEEEGRRYAYDDAFRKIWPLEGYLLKQRMYEQGVK